MSKIYWITRWALTNGVCPIAVGGPGEAEIWNGDGGTKYISGPKGLFVPIGKDAFDNEADANKRVAEMCKRGIAASKKKIKKLEVMLQDLENKGIAV